MIYLSHFLDAAICILIKLHYVQHSLVLLSCPIPPMLIARIEFNKFLPINAAIFKAELLGKLGRAGLRPSGKMRRILPHTSQAACP